MSGLLPTSIPIYTYRVESETEGRMATHITAKGKTSLLEIFPKLHTMLDASCDALLANATALSAVRVRHAAHLSQQAASSCLQCLLLCHQCSLVASK